MTQCFGNALFTRHPIVEVHRIDLSMERREPRGALAATVAVRGTPVHGWRRTSVCVSGKAISGGQILTYWIRCATRCWWCARLQRLAAGRSVVHVLDRRLGRPPRPASFLCIGDGGTRSHLDPSGRRVAADLCPCDSGGRLASDSPSVVADIEAARPPSRTDCGLGPQSGFRAPQLWITFNALGGFLATDRRWHLSP